MVDAGRCRWFGRRWRRWNWRGQLLLLFPGLVMIADDIAAAGVAAAVVTSAADAVGVVVEVVSTAATADAAATAAAVLSFSAVTFTVPIAMHLSRYGRLPSWNKSRTQCLVIFHSSTTKDIPSHRDSFPAGLLVSAQHTAGACIKHSVLLWSISRW